MEDVNHKYPNTAIPIAIIIIVIIPMVFALFLNARKVIEIKRQYSNASHPLKPICNTSTNLLMYVNVILTEIRKSINPRQKGQIIDLVFKTSAAQPSVILIILFYRSHSRLRIPLNDKFLETC